MKSNIALKLFVFALLLSSLPAAAMDREGKCNCTIRDVAGTWGYSETETIFAPGSTTPIPYASVGKFTIDRYGSLTGSRTASAGGIILEATIEGTATVNPDCTGTLTLNFFDMNGDPTGIAVKSVVYLNDATEARMIITSAPPFLTVLVTDAKKLSPDSDCEHGW